MMRIPDASPVNPSYMASPKPSGYQALHTAVRASDGNSLEVQVRTRSAHEDAEYGSASHSSYKKATTQPLPAAAAIAVSAVTALQPGTPLVRIAPGGKLSDAVVVDCDCADTMMPYPSRLLVAVRFGVRREPPQPAAYAALLQLATSCGWELPGHGNSQAALEEFVMGSDGRWHRLDAYGGSGGGVTVQVVRPLVDDSLREALSTPESRKQQQLRELLWGIGTLPLEDAGNAVSFFLYPSLTYARAPRGATVGDVLERYRSPSDTVVVNNRSVPSDTLLSDGDVLALD